MHSLAAVLLCRKHVRRRNKHEQSRNHQTPTSATRRKREILEAQPRPSYSIISLHYFVSDQEPNLTTLQGVDCKMASRERKSTVKRGQGRINEIVSMVSKKDDRLIARTTHVFVLLDLQLLIQQLQQAMHKIQQQNLAECSQSPSLQLQMTV